MFVLALGFESERPGANNLQSGRLAQLGERRVRNAEVGSSILPPSTNIPHKTGKTLRVAVDSAYFSDKCGNAGNLLYETGDLDKRGFCR